MSLGEHIRTTKKYIKILNQNGIHSVKDLLQYFPRTYEDRSQIIPLAQISPDHQAIVATKGKIIKKNIFNNKGRRIYECSFEDEEGSKAKIRIYQSGYMASQIHENKRYIIIGKPAFFSGQINFTHPDIIPTHEQQIDESHNIGRIYPIYPELQGIKPGRFAQKIRGLITQINTIFPDYYPDDFKKKFTIPDLSRAIHQMHYPDNYDTIKKAHYRIFFDKLCKIQLYNQRQKQEYQEKNRKEKSEPHRKNVTHIISKLPFDLTHAQKRVIKEIIDDLHHDKAMLRLLQGDVGSGKTVVATIAAYYTKQVFQGQTALLAPLEILAQQHTQSIAKLVLPLGLRIALLTGSTKPAEKRKIKQDIASGKIDIIIGTHALLQEDISFHNLQFVVIDEQHKFGVKQRAFFKQFNSPHILQMSATPIPRSMALTVFGEFDISIIDELPAGRKPIHTKIVSESQRTKLKPRILQKINEGQKVFIIAPLIESSDKLEDVKAVIDAHQSMKELFPEISKHIGLLHGKLKPAEKEQIIKDLKGDKLHMLVSTTVIEVGVDIPQATIMVILNAERFGLSQLHQLRGRIGRSDIQSYCFLETPSKSGDSYKRLKAMEKSNNGFELAQIDLEQRGPGEVLGTRQAGINDIPIQILTDIDFISTAQQAAIWLLKHYPKLEHLPELQNYINESSTQIIA